MLLVSVDVHLVLASCYLYILACWQNYYRKKMKVGSDHCLALCIDVSSLYTHISQDEGIDICMREITKVYDKETAATAGRPMQYILEDNIFKFNERISRQKFRTAMGTKMAPSFANIFMSDLENRFLQTQRILPLIWRRYIDDISS